MEERILVWKGTNLVRLVQSCRQAETVSFESLARTLRPCDTHQSAETIRRSELVNVETLDHLSLGTDETSELSTTTLSTHLSPEIELHVFQREDNSYLVAREFSDTVDYLAVSNVYGYTFATGGVWFFPRLNKRKHTLLDLERTFLSLASNALWTDGKQVLNNHGTWSMECIDDLGATMSKIILSPSLVVVPNLPGQSCGSWRKTIEGALAEQSGAELDRFHQELLRTKRREYLLRKSLAVLQTLSETAEPIEES